MTTDDKINKNEVVLEVIPDALDIEVRHLKKEGEETPSLWWVQGYLPYPNEEGGERSVFVGSHELFPEACHKAVEMANKIRADIPLSLICKSDPVEQMMKTRIALIKRAVPVFKEDEIDLTYSCDKTDITSKWSIIGILPSVTTNQFEVRRVVTTATTFAVALQKMVMRVRTIQETRG